jgi:peptide/nickel transport system permease protein
MSELQVRMAAPAASVGWRDQVPWKRYRLLIIGGVLVVLVLLSAIFAGPISPYSPLAIDVVGKLKPPSPQHLLGTDEIGRDVLSRTIFAARISMEVAAVAVSIGLLGGTVVGVASAYLGDPIDTILMRLMELVFSFPAILLAVVLMAILGTSVVNAMIAIGIIFIPGFARLARVSAQWILRQQYIEAAHAIGMSDWRIVFREIMPNVMTPLLVEGAVAFAYAVLLESSLSFLGLGAQPPNPSWGNMLNSGRGFMDQAPWLGIVPGSALFLAVLGFNLLGDGLRDWLDPHLKD